MKIISPHLDDCVLSLGQYLASGPGDVTVITVLAGIPDEGICTDYDASCGFTSSRAAMEARHREDDAALGLLGVHAERLGFFDQQYREPGCELDAGDQIARAIFARYSYDELMFAPLGIGHPDHRLVSDAALLAIARHADDPERPGLLLYEELPARVLQPEQVTDRLAVLREDRWEVSALPWPLEQGGRACREIKAEAIARYVSQFPEGADDPCLLVPERVWQVAR